MLNLICVLVIVGVFLVIVNKYIPMDNWIKTTINIVAVILIAIAVLRALGFVVS